MLKVVFKEGMFTLGLSGNLHSFMSSRVLSHRHLHPSFLLYFLPPPEHLKYNLPFPKFEVVIVDVGCSIEGLVLRRLVSCSCL